MGNIKIQDVQEQCQRGAMRAYTKDGGVYLEDTASKETVRLDYKSATRRTGYRNTDKSGSRVERMATEYSTKQEDGTVVGRHHHHAIIERTEGLTRDILESMWRDRNGERMGFTRCEYLDVEHGSVESLVRYISKNKRCARSWRQSRGLEKPKTPPPNDTKWSRKKIEDASTVYIDDAAYWEHQYPGYTLNRVETKVSDGGMRHTTVILRRAECWHGGYNSKKRKRRSAQ